MAELTTAMTHFCPRYPCPICHSSQIPQTPFWFPPIDTRPYPVQPSINPPPKMTYSDHALREILETLRRNNQLLDETLTRIAESEEHATKPKRSSIQQHKRTTRIKAQ